MEAIDRILNEVAKLQLQEKVELLHKLVDRMLIKSTPELRSKVDFSKYTGVGKGIWGVDAQTYINNKRNDERF